MRSSGLAKLTDPVPGGALAESNLWSLTGDDSPGRSAMKTLGLAVVALLLLVAASAGSWGAEGREAGGPLSVVPERRRADQTADRLRALPAPPGEGSDLVRIVAGTDASDCIAARTTSSASSSRRRAWTARSSASGPTPTSITRSAFLASAAMTSREPRSRTAGRRSSSIAIAVGGGSSRGAYTRASVLPPGRHGPSWSAASTSWSQYPLWVSCSTHFPRYRGASEKAPETAPGPSATRPGPW